MVVADSSVLITLSAIEELDLLRKMFTRICIPEAVWREVVVTGEGEPGAKEVNRASWIETGKIENTLLAHALQETLDQGESEAIVLAIEQKSELILLDEKPAREQALYFGLQPLGTIGVLVWGTQNKHLSALKPVLDQLIHEGDFRLSNKLYEKDLAELGEQIIDD